MSRALGLCPPTRDLERLLAEQLSAAERETVEIHVESCTSCQDQLDRLSAELARPAVQRPSAAEQWPEPPAEFLRRLRETPPSRLAADGSSPNSLFDSGSARLEQRRVGQYEILEKLGKGGMAAVYKARHVELGKIVALKILPTDNLDEVRVERFKNEVRAIGRLDHPHIVAAHDAGQSSGVHFLVMDLVDGEDLGRIVERHGRLGIPDACEAIRQAAIGLQHAFQRGLVHRDVKPTNLMLTRSGRVQVLDLGLARSFQDCAAERLTADGMVLGTADYLAPEQWEKSHTADIRADIYSLGCTLYHLLAGHPPFSGRRFGSVLQKLRGHADMPHPPIAGVRDDVPRALAAILDRMLAKSPDDRFATPAEVAEALLPFAAGSELARLIGSGTANPAANGPDTANLPSTLTENRSRHVRTGRNPRARRYAIPIALAGLAAAIIIAVMIFRPKRDNSNHSPIPRAAIVDMRVKHYRDDGATLLGDLKTSPATLRLNDGMVMAADLSVPAYCYLIAFNPEGSQAGIEQLCVPADAEGKGARSVAPDLRSDVRYPRDGILFTVDAVGLQVFVLAASTKPLPPYAVWRDHAGDIPWTGTKETGKWRWYFDGKEFTWLPRDRGELVGPPESLRALRDWFMSRTEFEAVQIYAFPVTANGK